MDILAPLFNSFTGQISFTLPGGARPSVYGTYRASRTERLWNGSVEWVHFVYIQGPLSMSLGPSASESPTENRLRVPRVTCYPLQPDVVSGRSEVDLCTPKNGGGISPGGPHLHEARQVNHECQIIRAVIFRSTQQTLSVRPEVTEMTIFLTAFTTAYLVLLNVRRGTERKTSTRLGRIKEGKRQKAFLTVTGCCPLFRADSGYYSSIIPPNETPN
ncbi:hypothetical protein QBC33DRAFT_217770 [Phialemonium atrogriseum]|uniref:Uncharacterized protein n=1 Tax=Phialemonium atrogriseum TaxID=1093897 RepID=A0AAJ0FJN8_9PEZI|nr:uncharacterized protein QBC33DRAFT_217770 [Phialemonium atrogriseum]KAK1770816.1 hypothetical protein QBC33DRAFT_217770 [Phialemonium atrogriseum]